MFKLVMRVGAKAAKPSAVMKLARACLEVLVASNRLAMRDARRRGKPIPKLYESGIRYQREPWGNVEEFADAITLLKRKWGDCDDLVAYRVAELREAGEHAKIRLYRRKNKRGTNTVHCQVRRAPSAQFPKGRIEDPSRFLGL
jgi:hypothetical protein